MSFTASPAPPQDVSPVDTEMAAAGTPGFDERWMAWRARGAAHDRAVRRRMIYLVPLLASAAAVVYVLLLS